MQMIRNRTLAGGLVVLAAASFSIPVMAQQADKKMNFFITSQGVGKGADMGGLKGADAHCQNLAKAAGAGNKQWRAYLSTTALGNQKAVNARDRIGRGPWYNAKGEMVAKDLDDLHSDQNKVGLKSALSEKGAEINGRTSKPNRHDILTGSDSHGRAISTYDDTTCGNWTRGGAGSAIVGHHDRAGLSDSLPAKSWNFSHASRGCSQTDLQATGGDGLFYCFAAR